MINLNERHPVEYIISFIGVVLFHILVIWLLVIYLRAPDKKQADTMPVQVQIVDVASSASAAAAVQPPAPEMIVPPPPEIEPPPINTEAPPQPKPPPVVKKPTKKAPPKTIIAPAPSAPAGTEGHGQSTSPGEGKPDRSAGSRPLNGAQIEYPPDMEAAQKEGRVILSCDVETTGSTSNCHVISASGGQSFIQAAMKYVNSARYRPATKNGVPIKEIGHRYTINFRL